MVIVRIQCRFGECLYDMGRGRQIRITNPEVDNIHSLSPLLGFHLIDAGEEVWGQIIDPFCKHGRKVGPEGS